MRAVQILDASCLNSTTGPLSAEDPLVIAFSKAFAAELSSTGLCGISHTLISNNQISEMYDVAERFFARPLEEKNRLSMRAQGRAWRGYFATGQELTAGVPDVKEGVYFGTDHSASHSLVQAKELMHGINAWPEGSIGVEMKSVVERHMMACGSLCRNLLRAIAIGLGFEQDIFDKLLLPEPTQLFRIFNYPPLREHVSLASDWGVAEHTDMGFITLLLQGDGPTALEAQTRMGEWVSVPPQRGVFFINIGDMLEYWSQGLLWATPHRVRGSQKVHRLSFPYFFDPAWNQKLTRLGESHLEQLGWTREKRQNRSAQKRWDALVLHGIEDMTYGEFVTAKIRNVFPWLADSVANPS